MLELINDFAKKGVVIMTKRPFLLNFKREVPLVDVDQAIEESNYSEEMQMSILPSGELSWSARSRRYPTSCYTAGHTIKAGYTSSGKWKSTHYVPAKTDRRSGR
jgi:hypothetical protein